MVRHVKMLFGVLFGLGLHASVLADIINVPGDQPTIQAGINAATGGDEVVVAPGTYVENINFLGKAITVRSTDPTDPAVIVSTIINGGGSGSVVVCTSGEGADTVLSGFVITGGNTRSEGGGMYNLLSSPTVSNCTFSGNAATIRGGGMANSTSNSTVTNCTFSNNTAGFGGGMANTNQSYTMVTNCTFSGNTANGSGGGMYNFLCVPTVTHCTFSGNTAMNVGGGMRNSGRSPTVAHCTFSLNTATNGGGGMYNTGIPTVSNCTFSGNASAVGGGMYISGGNTKVSDCQIWGNTPDQIFGPFTDDGGNIMGPYCPPPKSPCPSDITGDGEVGPLDLALVLGFWGSCP